MIFLILKYTRHSFPQLMIVFLAVVILSVSAFGNNAYAIHVPGAGMSLSAEGSGSIINVWGETDRTNEDVTMTVIASNGNIIQVDQLSTSGGSYSTTINVSGWNDGTYKISVNQGQSSKYNLSVDIDVSSGASTTSISNENKLRVHEEDVYVSSQNVPTVPSLAKLTITASGIEGSNTINVSGTTDRGGDIVLKVIAPNRNIVSIDQVTPSGGSYSTIIKTGGPLWSQDGTYLIRAQQGPTNLGNTFVGNTVDSPNIGLINYQASAEIKIVDGLVIPEFGTVAAMILVMAIVSIIVVTAKTKLSLVQRY